MNRDALRPVAIAAVCAIAIVFAAATLTSTVPTSGDGAGVGGGDGVGANEGGSFDLGGKKNTSSGILNVGKRGRLADPICVDVLNTIPVRLALVAGIVGLALLLRRQFTTLSSVGLTTAIAGPVIVVYAALTGCGSTEGPLGLPEALTGQATGGGGSSSSSATGPAVPVDTPIVIYLLVAAGLVLVVAAALSDRDVLGEALGAVTATRRAESTEDPGGLAPDPDAVGRAAGRAADRIETGDDVENEVYRAWVEMTRHLDVDHPESSTPAEFAAAATTAGMDEADVTELTELFEAVRYGGQRATEDRENRAVAALRRIETTYADERGEHR